MFFFSSFKSQPESDEVIQQDPPVPGVPSGQRIVRCCFCHHPFLVPAAGTILTCPKCSKRARVDDIVISGTEFRPKIETFGKVYVRRRAKRSARTINAGLGLEVLGELEADSVVCGKLYLGPASRWSGDCKTGSMNMDETASVLSGRFSVQPKLIVTVRSNPLNPSAVRAL